MDQERVRAGRAGLLSLLCRRRAARAALPSPSSVFCLASSSAYVMERRARLASASGIHADKRRRPIAAGASRRDRDRACGAAGVRRRWRWWPGRPFLGLRRLRSCRCRPLYSLGLKHIPVVDVAAIARRLRAADRRRRGRGRGAHVAWLFLATFLLAMFLGAGQAPHRARAARTSAGGHRRRSALYRRPLWTR